MLSARVAHITPSATLAIANRAASMRADGLDVCSFSAGEPDFTTPAHIREAAIQALERGETKYGPVAGLPQLREAIAHKLQTENHLSLSPNQVMVSNGGKQTLFNLAMALLDPGDEVIIPTPYWVSYPEIVSLVGAVPVKIPTDQVHDYKLQPEQLAEFITPKTKLVILNSPSNPTGTVYTQAELEALGEILLQHRHIYVVSDEIYEKLVYDDVKHISIAALDPALMAQTIISNGFSKAFAMTGWRLGYLAGPEPVIQAATRLQSHSTSNVCTFAQYGALAALADPKTTETIDFMCDTMSKRRDLMFAALTSISGFSCKKPQGAFYIFADISFSGLNSVEFCQKLLEEFYVALVPGAAFGHDDSIRLSYAIDMESIEKGMDRLTHFVQSICR